MSRLQRKANRRNAERLYRIAREKRLMAHTCENCGKPGGHWISMGVTLEQLMNGNAVDRGFWICDTTAAPKGGA